MPNSSIVYTYLLSPKVFDWITFSRNMKHDFNISSVKPESKLRGAQQAKCGAGDI